jgi:AraC family transcriptional regulator, regulatory protein of adaptative response / methylated-DNA-[protein]-cysteine methyltransferase
MEQTAQIQAIFENDPSADGLFVYGVTTTGVYCRPSCKSRAPKKVNIALFELSEAAEQAGFRACRKCRPELLAPVQTSTSVVHEICRFLKSQMAAETGKKVTLNEIADHTGYSADHVSRLFKSVMGISPIDFYDSLRTEKLKSNLSSGEEVASAAYGAGFGSSSRLYEKSRERLGMTPASYAKGGKGAEIAYALVDSFLGRMLVAGTRQGICAIYFGDDDTDLVQDLREEFPKAEIAPEIGQLSEWTVKLVSYLEKSTELPDLPLDMFGTAFQRRVWQELLKIGPGETKTYGQIAREMGQDKSSRAVGRACATNPVSLIVPCHRVIGGDGKLHGYRWGLQRKELLRRWEGA